MVERTGDVSNDSRVEDELNPENTGPWRCTPCGIPCFENYPLFYDHIVKVKIIHSFTLMALSF